MGQAGSFRANALGASQMSAAQTHEERLDQVAKLRVKRNTPPLVYSPYSSVSQGEVPLSLHPKGENTLEQILAMIAEKDAERHLSLIEAYDAHIEGALRNKGAGKLCLHAFIQFPTDLEITSETERLMLAQAVDFVNRHHGGMAVFHARLDRDEAGRHGVDVFYSPKYTKVTKRRSEIWVAELTEQENAALSEAHDMADLRDQIGAELNRYREMREEIGLELVRDDNIIEVRLGDVILRPWRGQTLVIIDEGRSLEAFSGGASLNGLGHYRGRMFRTRPAG